MAPGRNESPKRNGGAPPQLTKLDLETERQKSTRIVGAKTPADKKKPNANKPHDGDPTNNQATTKKKTAGKVKPTGKASKSGKVAVAIASDGPSNDIGDLSKAPTENKSKRTSTKAKPRPASAGIGPAKPLASTRPASAGAVSPTKKPGNESKRKLDERSSSKLAFVESQLVSESDENERSLGDKELAAKGIYYDIFVQTRRCETLCYEVGLKLAHIRKMKKKFDDNDMYHSGEITQAEFFFILNEERRPLTKGILQYASVAPDQKFLSFDAFLLCVVSFAVLTPPEVYHYAFDLYDADGSGTLDEYEFAKMSKELQSTQFSFPKNTQMAISMIGGHDGGRGGGYVSEDGLVDLGEFMRFAKLFPVAFYPLCNFQKNVRKATLGESTWSKLAARKLKIQELVSHMRRNYGAIPELSLGERLWSIVDDEILAVRKRAAEIYGRELCQRRLIGDTSTTPGER